MKIGLSELILTITAVIIFVQSRSAVKALQMQGMLKIQDMIHSLQKNSSIIYELPSNIILCEDMYKGSTKRFGKRAVCAPVISEQQKLAASKLTDQQINTIRYAINTLNDIGHLVEAGYVSYGDFLGKYHTLIIRYCHIIEVTRQWLQNDFYGGNYGQRLLRMRDKAILFHKMHRRHRATSVYIFNNASGERIQILSGVERASWWEYPIWFVERKRMKYFS